MKNSKYSGKTFSELGNKLGIASDKIYDAIDIIMDMDTPYLPKHDEIIRKKLQRIADMIHDTLDEIEAIDDNYYKSFK